VPADVPLAAQATREGDGEETGWAPVAPSMREHAPSMREHAPAYAAQQETAPQKRGGWTGTVAGVNRRADQVGKGQGSHSMQVITFRLEQFTEHGDRGRVLSVELRGATLRGDLANGDRVEARGRMRGGVVKAKSVQNLTTGATVAAVGSVRRRVLGGGAIAVKIVFAAAWLCGLALIIYVAASHHFF
jgi:hypothetical protein